MSKNSTHQNLQQGEIERELGRIKERSKISDTIIADRITAIRNKKDEIDQI
jgi:hypothetical protein